MKPPEGRSFAELVRDRLRKRGFYDTPAYWDMKAAAYEGLARSNWPSNAYNRRVDARQMALVDSALGDVRGLSIADIGCGTGRASVHLAERGASVTGLDFAPRALEAAAAEARRRSLSIDFRTHDVLAVPPPDLAARFDAVLTLGCLAIACRDAGAFERALDNLTALVKPRGKLLFIEPVHASRLLRRILAMSMAEWIERCERRSFSLVARGGLCFAPARFALAFREVPEPVNGAVFNAGERILGASPALERLSDYKYLFFERSL